MKQLITKQRLPIGIDEAWDFFSSPGNLEKITPRDMHFEILNQKPGKMYAGMIILYKVSPFLGIKLKWGTEITQVAEKKYFIDNQLSGPFKVWHHQHIFEPIDGGIEMTDIVTYAAPLGFLGKIAEKLFVDRRVRQIFEFREKILEELFPN